MSAEKTLSPEQKEAVTFPADLSAEAKASQKHRHLVIEAGAGAGKTTLLTERVHWLLTSAPRQFKLDAGELILVTFSRAADEELRSRVEKRLRRSEIPQDTLERILSRLHISTIDSLFMQLVSNLFPIWWEHKRNHISEELLSEWGLLSQRFPPIPNLVSEDELFPELAHLVVQFVQDNALAPEEEFATLDFVLAGAFESKTFRTTPGMTSHYKGLERITAAMLHENFLREDAPALHFALEKIHPSSIKIINGLRELARQQFHKRVMQGRLTHNDRMLFLYHIVVAYADLPEQSFFRTGSAAHSVQQYKELIVDEYQDTNELQHTILSTLISPKEGRMVVVGDPKQSIYGFRSAHVGVFQQLKENPQWKLIELTCNYRSHPDLLPWINYLSDLSFAFKNNKIPQEFLNTSFSLSAQRTFVSGKSLDAGRTKETSGDSIPHPRVMLLGGSLSRDRATSELPDSLPTQHAFTCWALSRELFEIMNNGKYTWKDVVILCETNDWVNKTHQQLQTLSIPSIPKTSRPSDEHSLAQRNADDVGLLLGKWLCSPLNQGEFARLLWSGFFNLNFLEVSQLIVAAGAGHLGEEFVYLDEKSKKTRQLSLLPFEEKWHSIAEHIGRCRQLAAQHYFSGWQILRWGWNSALIHVQSQMNIDMENAALALQQVLQSWSQRELLEKAASSLAAVSKKPAGEETKQNHLSSALPPLNLWPEELLQNKLRQLRLADLAADPNLNAVTVCTIHGAKGLEWPIVVFWPGSKRERAAENFVMKSGDQATHIKWLAEDTESASLLPWINNPNPPQDIVSVQVETSTGEQTVRWSADLQDRLEQDYERQRVFYTAYTRAREMLILVSPAVSGRTQKNLRDKLSTLKISDEFDSSKLKLSGLEANVFSLFADTFFDLRKADKRGSRPQTPWLGREIHAKVLSEDWQNILSMRDYGPDWLPDFHAFVPPVSQHHEEKENTQNIALEKNWQEIWALAQQSKTKQTPWARPPEASSEAHSEHFQRPALTREEKEEDENAARGESEPTPVLSASETGMRFHALMEHGDLKNAPKKAFLNRLISDALITEHELEIWGVFDLSSEENGDTKHIHRTQRKIIDLFCVIPQTKWPKHLWNSRCIGTSPNNERTLQEQLSTALATDTNLYLVVDFKTGVPSVKHIEQMRGYLRWIREILSTHPQLIVSGVTQNTLFASSDKPLMGILYYTSANTAERPSEFAPCYVDVDKNTSLLFVSPE